MFDIFNFNARARQPAAVERAAVRRGLAGAALAATLVGNLAWAHHSFALFDKHKTVTIQGTVKEFQWENPHVWIDIVVTDPATKRVVNWPVEAASVIDLRRMGWSRDSLKLGDKVTMVLNPLRDGEIGGSMVSASVNGAQIGHGWNYKKP